jgi:hypothetical protein
MAKSTSTYTLIDAVENINEDNFLQVDFRHLADKVNVDGFKNTLDKLWYTGRALEKLNAEGQLNKAENIRSYYFQAIKWLKGQEQTNDFIALAPLGSNPADMDNLAQQFMNSFMPGYLDNFFNNHLAVSYYASSQEIENKPILEGAKKSLDQHQTLLKDDIKKFNDDEISRLTKAVALEEWQGYYDNLVLDEDQSKTPEKPKQNNQEDRFYLFFPIDWLILKMMAVFKHKTPLTNHLFEKNQNYYSQMKHYKLWKNIWLTLFVVFELLDFALVNYLFEWSFSENLLEILSIKLIIAILFGTLYVSANKNYRIYANLYDQTLLRSVIAKTLQGIIMDDSRLDPAYKNILLTVAAQSMFEMKPSGHLTKKESASPLNELLAALLSRPT